jgi:hypothetical protein
MSVRRTISGRMAGSSSLGALDSDPSWSGERLPIAGLADAGMARRLHDHP